MAVQRPETLSRERAGELVRAWAGGRPSAIGSVLGRVTAVDQVGILQRVESLQKRSIKRDSKTIEVIAPGDSPRPREDSLWPL